jgi:hypothetical protein
MGDLDLVSWEEIVAATGPPAAEVTEHVDRMTAELSGREPYEAVKAVHDALYDDEIERTVPSLGEPYVTAYLLEKAGVIAPSEGGAGDYRSMVDRRPSRERLEELFWERERTLWWIGMQAGVHPSLVTYWFYEANIALMERNLTEDSLERIRDYRESNGG